MSSPMRTISRGIRRTNETKSYWLKRQPKADYLPESVKRHAYNFFKRLLGKKEA